MKVNIEVEEKDISQLSNVKNLMLFDRHENRFYVVKSLEYEIVEREKIRDDFNKYIKNPLEAVGVVFPKKDTESK
jgi:hypothetical protein